MKKTIVTVFVIIGILLIGLLAWSMIFGDSSNQGGLLADVWDAVRTPINNTWQSITGSSSELIPAWRGSATNLGGVGGGTTP